MRSVTILVHEILHVVFCMQVVFVVGVCVSLKACGCHSFVLWIRLFRGSLCASGFFESWLLQVCWPPRACPVLLLLLFPCVAAWVCLCFFLLRALSLVYGVF